MRLAAVMLATLALASSAAGNDGDWATAAASGTTVTLRLHYLMTCGQPGEGPVEITLPSSLRFGGSLSGFVNGKQRPTLSSAHTATVQLPKPPEVTCMSIGPGVLTVALRGVRVPTVAGVYTIRAAIGTHRFSVRLRIQ